MNTLTGVGPSPTEDKESISQFLLREMTRLYSLPDLWLATELIRLSRHVRSVLPDEFGQSYAKGTDARLLWDIIPAIARRLAPWLRLIDGEGQDPNFGCLESVDVRHYAGQFVLHSSLYQCSFLPHLSAAGRAMRVLGNEPFNGNPVVMALDRLVPPAGCNDAIACQMRQISALRGHSPIFDAWEPAFQNALVRSRLGTLGM